MSASGDLMPPDIGGPGSWVAMLSYAEDLFFGVLSDYGAVADIDALSRGIELAVARLVAISKQRKKIHRRGGLSLVVSV